LKKLTILIGMLSILLNPAWAGGKIYEYTDEQGNIAYTDSLENVPKAQAGKYKLISEKPLTFKARWISLKHSIESKRDQTENLMLGMTILERLVMGIGLAFFSLVTLYVLLFKSTISRSLPRILFRLALILIVITSSTLSYFALSQGFITKTNSEEASPEDSVNLSNVKGRLENIKQLGKERNKILNETGGP